MTFHRRVFVRCCPGMPSRSSLVRSACFFQCRGFSLLTDAITLPACRLSIKRCSLTLITANCYYNAPSCLQRRRSVDLMKHGRCCEKLQLARYNFHRLCLRTLYMYICLHMCAFVHAWVVFAVAVFTHAVFSQFKIVPAACLQ